jgi:DnaJ like chaperone protein
MGNFAKWIGGGLGWAFGGPVGALIGFALGSMIGDAEIKTTALGTGKTTEGDFKMSLLVHKACIMKADGRVDRS